MVNRGTMCLIVLSTLLREFVDDRRAQMRARADRGSMITEYAMIAGATAAAALVIVAVVKSGALARLKTISSK